MRGKATSPSFSLSILGITPAYAGKSIKVLLADEIDRDHPRVCGEKTKKIP